MDQLRLILLGVGVIVIAFIYLWGMRKQIRARLEERRRRRAALRADNQPMVYFDEPEPQPEPEPEPEPEPQPEPEYKPISPPEYETRAYNRAATPTYSSSDKPIPTAESSVNEDIGEQEEQPFTVLLTIMAPAERPFSGIDILQAAHEADLKLNKNGSLDFLSDTEQGHEVIFRIGHLKESGRFDLSRIKELSTPGLLLVLELPGPLPASKAVDRMTAIAARLAKSLSGTVCDERRNKLNTETLTALRERAVDFERRLSY